MLEQINWDRIYDFTSINDQVEYLQQNIKYLYDQTVPLKTKIINNKTKPWFNKDVRSAITARNLFYRKWKKYRTDELYNIFKIKRRDADRIIKNAKYVEFKNNKAAGYD